MSPGLDLINPRQALTSLESTSDDHS